MMVWACGSRLAVTGGRAATRAGRSLGLAAWRGSTQPGLRGQGTTAGTEHNIVSSPIPDFPLPSGNVATYLLANASKWPERTALECSITGRGYTYSQLVDLTARWGGQVLRLGLRRGDTLAVMMQNCPEYPVVVLGANSVGVACTVINSTYTPEEVCGQLVDSGASLVVHDDHCAKVMEAAVALSKKPLQRIVNTDSSPPDGVASLRELLQDASVAFADPVEVDGKEVSVLPYSSGTTGKPKGVMISHDAYSSSTAIYCQPHFFPLSDSDPAQETFLAYLPLFHISGLLALMAAGLRHGARVVMVPKFEPKAYVSNIEKYKVGMLQTVPTMLNFLMKSPEVNTRSMASVFHVLCGAAPVSQTAARTFMEKVDKPITFQEAYGMTEVMVTHANPLNSSRLGSCGLTMPNVKTKVVDLQTGEALPANQEGEICILTPSRMNGYINNEEATRATIDEGGWVHSGDIGFYDQDGYFSIVDRAKDLIKVKAFQVSPSELEDVLLKHPKVQEVGVVGVPDERLGEAPRAYIVTSSPVHEKEIQEFMAERLAPHKQLAGGVVFLPDLPKNQTGKVMRRQLREMN